MIAKVIHIIFDYGHGCNCPGKCSPDKSFYEWLFNREVGMEIAHRLREKGYQVHEIWTQDHEPLSDPAKTCTTQQLRDALNWRWKEVNKLCATYGAANCISISIHANAAGADGLWHTASGFCAYVGATSSAKSKRLAKSIYDQAAKRGLQGNRWVPDCHYWTQSLAMCERTACPAVLTESLYYDNQGDLAVLKSPQGREKIIQTHVEGITDYLNSL